MSSEQQAHSGPATGTWHLEFRYFGFHAALRRYRTTTVIGWGVTAAGLAGFIASWSLPGERGLLDALLAGGAILAGLTIVQLSVMGLQSYVTIPFPPLAQDAPDSERSALEALEPLMTDVREGGWQEAFHAIGGLRAIGERCDLPPPERRGPLPTKR